MSGLFHEVGSQILRADRIIDVGPGIRPQPFYRAEKHICIEPHGEYADWLEKRGYPVIRKTAIEALPGHEPVGVIFMLDVIEHMEKTEGVLCVQFAISRAKQVVIFTPYGFVPQTYAQGEKDAWGMNGMHWQTHKSGWKPEDFPQARIFEDRTFHADRGGAFFALIGGCA